MDSRFVIHLLKIALFLPCFFFASCETPATYNTPSAYAREGFSYSPPEGGYDPNPSPEAIVGMWTNTVYSRDGERLVTSFLFNRDGTGMSRSSAMNKDAIPFPFSWKYGGGGNWIMTTSDSAVSHFRIGSLPLEGGKTGIYQVYCSSVSDAPVVRYVQVK